MSAKKIAAKNAKEREEKPTHEFHEFARISVGANLCVRPIRASYIFISWFSRLWRILDSSWFSRLGILS